MSATNLYGYPTTAPANGWWAVQDTNGAIGLQKGSAPSSNTVQAAYLGASDTVAGLYSTPAKSAAVADALTSVGATGNQIDAVITQIDAGAGKSSALSWLFVGSTSPGSNSNVTAGTPTGTLSTTPSGDVTAGGIDIGGSFFNALGSIWGSLTNPSTWLTVLKFIGGAVLMYFAIKELTGAPGVTDVASKAVAA